MKSFFTAIIALCLFISGIHAQVTAPAPSPSAKVEQKVGLTDVTIEYSRPSAKGRAVFGELVPFGKVWRAGANAATKISFSTDISMGGVDLKAGTYALLITPNPTSWQLHFFNYDSGNWGAYVADGAPAAAAVITVDASTTPVYVESWTIGVGDLRSEGASLYFLWEKTYVSAKFNVPTDKAVMASIEKTMAGPSAGDYYSAASYYLAEGKDMNKALEWINKSIEMGNERFWVLRTKALIQARLGDKQGAIATAQRSTELAKEAGNEEYPHMNAISIAEWSK